MLKKGILLKRVSTTIVKNTQLSTDIMSSRSAVRLKALDQARQKLEDLTKQDVVTFTFIISEEGAEMMGEETLANEAMALFEEHGIMELARRIRISDGNLFKNRPRASTSEYKQPPINLRLFQTL